MIVRFCNITIPASNVYSIRLVHKCQVQADYITAHASRIDMERMMTTYMETYDCEADAKKAFEQYSTALGGALRQ